MCVCGGGGGGGGGGFGCLWEGELECGAFDIMVTIGHQVLLSFLLKKITVLNMHVVIYKASTTPIMWVRCGYERASYVAPPLYENLASSPETSIKYVPRIKCKTIQLLTCECHIRTPIWSFHCS